MRYLFLGLVALNIIVFGYYSFIHQPSVSKSVQQQQATLVNPVAVSNVSDELPPMIGSKK